MDTLKELSNLIKERNTIGKRIAAVIGRPATLGHVGEFIASIIFDIHLEDSASAKGIDGYFRSGALSGKSVNVKFYGKQESTLDITPDQLPNYYLVMTGPRSIQMSSKGDIRPWLIEYVYLFDAFDLIATLRNRGVTIGTASSIRKFDWEDAEVYPRQTNPILKINQQQWELLKLFSGD
jgi:hypothetical protein